MLNKRHTLKYRKNIVRVVCEPDYSEHEAWSAGVPPTPETCPDAFYIYRQQVFPRKQKSSSRREAHSSLTASMLRKRLYAAGLRGEELKRVFAEILAGDKREDGLQIPGNWNIANFRTVFGKQVARHVLRFVSAMMIILDEFGSYASPVFNEFIQKAMRTGRKNSVEPMTVTQTFSVMPLPPKNVKRRVSFSR